MSPLVLGVGDDEVFLASDSAAILEHTKKMIFLENGDFVEIKNGKYKFCLLYTSPSPRDAS